MAVYGAAASLLTNGRIIYQRVLTAGAGRLCVLVQDLDSGVLTPLEENARRDELRLCGLVLIQSGQMA
jgi:hypothetical protein